jgi:GR25 family glycosyltransferase involved in LPS biosynthesis
MSKVVIEEEKLFVEEKNTNYIIKEEKPKDIPDEEEEEELIMEEEEEELIMEEEEELIMEEEEELIMEEKNTDVIIEEGAEKEKEENVVNTFNRVEKTHSTINQMYILNLDSKTERWDTMTNQLKKVNNQLPYYQFCGVDGSKLNMNEIRNNVPRVSGKFFMTQEIYGKAHSHYLLWKNILKENMENNLTNKDWFLVLEDDAIIPDNFNEYINNLQEFLNKIPSDIINYTDMFNLSPVGDYCKKKNLHNKVMTLLTSIGTMIKKKRKFDNSILFQLDIMKEKWSLLNSNFPLCTHAYLVNKKQIENLIKIIDEKKIYYHLDWMLNFEGLNINSITPISIKRGGFNDATTSTLTNPSLPVKVFTMFNKELACDLGKPAFNIMGMYQINILIIFYAIFILIWEALNIPGRLNDFFNRI